MVRGGVRCELQWSGEVVKGSGVKRVVGCEEGGERGSSTRGEYSCRCHGKRVISAPSKLLKLKLARHIL